MTSLQSVATKIIRYQERVIGPLAWSEAGKVQGLKLDGRAGQIEIFGQDQMKVIDDLVAQYERLFGKASHEVCREAAASIVATMQPSEVPVSLR